MATRAATARLRQFLGFGLGHGTHARAPASKVPDRSNLFSIESAPSSARLPRPPARLLPRGVRLLASGGGAAGAVTAAVVLSQKSTSSNQTLADRPAKPDGRDPSLPRFRLSEVRKHGAGSERPWVTYEDKVYDITDWVPAHPGGEVIIRAAGGAIDRYWDIFTIHKSPYVREILDQYLIGLVSAADLIDGYPEQSGVQDPFVDDPARDPALITHTAKPHNAETPPAGLQSFLTPNALFYIRNHMWVPRVEGDGGQHVLTVELMDGSTRDYTVDELRRRFPRHKATVTLQCSGNRRWDMTWQAEQTNGLQWNVGAISTAEWEGVRLSDVLADAGLDTSVGGGSGGSSGHGNCEEGGNDETSPQHVQFSGLEAYGASIPLDKALDPRGDVLLAFSMNGQSLPRDHGFPLRAVVPGNVAARSVKWLSRIVVSDEESPKQWQRRDYKCFGPNVRKPDWDSAPAIQEMPVTSAISSVRLIDQGDAAAAALSIKATQGHELKAAASGYAYSGGGRAVVRVDVSADMGATWDQAELLDGDVRKHGNKEWAWKRWTYKKTVRFDETTFQGCPRCAIFIVKATDSAYNTQPQTHDSIYNQRGNLATAWNFYVGCLDPNAEGGVRRMRGWREQDGKRILIKDGG